jgi:multiple sugar transport system permease protein
MVRNKEASVTKAGLIMVWIVLLIGAISMLIPFYIMLAMSLKNSAEAGTTSIFAWPKQLHPENYLEVLRNPEAPFKLFLKNTFFISTLSTIGVVGSSAMVAYPFARMDFIGRDRLFLLLVSTMMLPGIVTMIPTYILYKYLHWIDTFNPMIVPAYFGGGAYNIFLFRQFFMSIPKDLDEAARIDGASPSLIFWRIMMPLSMPALATVGVFSFSGAWHDFMGPLLYLNDSEKQTLELGLRTYRNLADTRWELIMAASVLVSLPLIIMFLFSQRYFVKGIVMTGIK